MCDALMIYACRHEKAAAWCARKMLRCKILLLRCSAAYTACGPAKLLSRTVVRNAWALLAMWTATLSEQQKCRERFCQNCEAWVHNAHSPYSIRSCKEVRSQSPRLHHAAVMTRAQASLGTEHVRFVRESTQLPGSLPRRPLA